MAKFYVVVYEEETVTYEVEADSAEEAEENYWDGDVCYSRACASEVLEVREEF